MTTAAAAILVLLDGSAPAADVITGRVEVIGMTGRAERLILREWPGNIATDNAAVALGAGQTAAMVSRVVGIGIMAEYIGCPGIGRVTHITLRSGIDVANRLTRRTVAVVTGITGACGTRIMHPGTTNKGRRGMAEMAIQPGRDVGAVHAWRRITVVAGRAIVHDAGMIKGAIGEIVADCMTRSTISIRRGMSWRFPPCTG